METRWIRTWAPAAALVVMSLLIGPAAGAPAATVCTWGGTPAETTGTFTVKPGLTNTPAAEPLKFYAEGPLAGGAGCTGKLVFDGVVGSGSTCAVSTFEGKVKGLPGVARFQGAGTVVAPSILFDRAGNIVGAEQPQVVTGAGSGSEVTDCATPEGFTDGSFSSVIELLVDRA